MADAETLSLTKRYGMSLTKAAEVPVPCGKSAGRLMGETTDRDLYWFATRKVSPGTKPPMRDAICAARILRSAKRTEMVNARFEKSKSANQTLMVDAKRALVECLSCGLRRSIPRVILGRRGRPTCLSCGGTLTELVNLVDEFLTPAEVKEEFGVSDHTLNQAAKSKEVIVKHNGKHRTFGRASLERYLLAQAATKSGRI